MNFVNQRLLSLALVLALSLNLPNASAEVMSLHIGNTHIHAEVARTPQSHNQGLMFRKDLCANCGMLFVFKKADRLRFWMKNTFIPLSVAFISADGTILNIEQMQPHSTEKYFASGNALYALEMNQGWFSRMGIASGQQITELAVTTR